MEIKLSTALVFTLCINWVFALDNSTCFQISKEESKVLSRRRRHIVFPKGASFQLVYCNTYNFRDVVPIFRFGTTLGLAWQLPDDPKIYQDHKNKHRIYKRNLLKKTETYMQKILSEYDGRQCVLKALCESGQRTPSKKEFLTEVLHRIFSVIDDDGSNEEDETDDDKVYKKAHRSVNQNCDALYPKCTFSFFK